MAEITVTTKPDTVNQGQWTILYNSSQKRFSVLHSQFTPTSGKDSVLISVQVHLYSKGLLKNLKTYIYAMPLCHVIIYGLLGVKTISQMFYDHLRET